MPQALILAVYILFGVVAFLGILYLALYIYYWKQFQYWPKHEVPHRKPKFFFGNIARICLKKCPGEVIGELYHKAKGHAFMGIWLWFEPAIVLRDLDLIRTILVRDFVSFHDRVPHVNIKKDPLSGHAFSLRGSRWRNIRPKLTPAFSTGKMKCFFEKFVQYSDDLVDLINRETSTGGYAVLNMREVAARFTTDVSLSYALGIESGCLKDSDAIFRKMGRKVFAPTMKNCIRSLLPVLLHRAAKLVSLHPTIPEVATFFLDAAKQMIEYREKSPSQNDFLQTIVDMKKIGKLDLADKGNGENKKTVDWTFSNEEAAAQAFIFFIAGFETSSITIQYALYEMALNQDMQEILRSEIKDTLAKYDGKLTYDGMNEMTYLSKVVHETLRKYPVVPLVFRTCTKEYKMPGSDFVVPKGMQLLVSVIGIHHNPDLYPEPEKFDPERFSEEEKAKRHHYAYLPFGEGPRNCLGMRFSLIQKKVGLISLLNNFRFEICDQSPVPHRYNKCSFFLAPFRGMKLLVTRLDHK